MPRRKVDLCPGEYYHVYNRGANRQCVFFERENYGFFLRKLREYVLGDAQSSPAASSSRAAEILAYCLMPNHYHLLLKLNEQTFSKRMQSFGQSYTNAINKRCSRVGPLFGGRFQAIHVDQEAYLLHLTRYIHLNPVAAGLVKRPQEWEFSSYLEYVRARDGTLPQSDVIISQFKSIAAYRKFVESGIGRQDRAIDHLIFEEE